MTFQTEFPDFPVADMPAIPAGFDDVSWCNDTCPSFLNEAAGLIIFIDFPKVEDREEHAETRFSLRKYEDGTLSSDDDVETDDWLAIMEALIERGVTEGVEDALTAFYTEYLIGQGLPEGDAMEHIMGTPLSAEQRQWISRFILIWEAMRAAEDEG